MPGEHSSLHGSVMSIGLSPKVALPVKFHASSICVCMIERRACAKKQDESVASPGLRSISVLILTLSRRSYAMIYVAETKPSESIGRVRCMKMR